MSEAEQNKDAGSPLFETPGGAGGQGAQDGPTTPTVKDSVHMDVDLLLQGFRECLKGDGLHMDGYLRAYTEMAKFFEVMGTVFTFVTNDVYSKLNILRCYRKGGSGDFYYSIQSMLQYEKDQPSLTQPSASRTLLRLHRALDFVSGFLRELYTLEMEVKLGPVAQPIYARTLAQHHGWIVSKTVSAVLLLLPNKKGIFERLVGDDVALQRNLNDKAPELCDVMDKVFQATQEYYSEYGMLDLP